MRIENVILHFRSSPDGLGLSEIDDRSQRKRAPVGREERNRQATPAQYGPNVSPAWIKPGNTEVAGGHSGQVVYQDLHGSQVDGGQLPALAVEVLDDKAPMALARLSLATKEDGGSVKKPRPVNGDFNSSLGD